MAKIVDILYRPSQIRDLKSYILIEVETKEQAFAVQNFYMDRDQGVFRRNQLGGTSLEISILTEPHEAGNAYSIIKPNIWKHLGESASSQEARGKIKIYLILRNCKHSFSRASGFAK